MFDEPFIDGLPDNPALAGKKICDALLSFYRNDSGMDAHYEEYLQALALLEAFAQARGINVQFPSLSSNITDNIAKIVRFFSDTRGLFDQIFTDGVFEGYKVAFDRKFGKGFFYDFSDGDLKRIQELIRVCL
jgi:hypothetical protein